MICPVCGKYLPKREYFTYGHHEDEYAEAQPRGSDLAELRVGRVARTLGHGTIEELDTGWSLEVA